MRSNGIDFEGIKSLSQSKFITNLKSLNLRFNNLGRESLEVLANSENFTLLEELNLHNTSDATNHIPRFASMLEDKTIDEGYVDIVKSPHMKNLKSLNLRFCNIGNVIAKEIANSSSMSNLTMLNLQHNYVGDEGVKNLSKSSQLINLTHLNLQFNCLTQESIPFIANSSTFSQLKMLNVSNNYFPHGSAHQFFTSPVLSKVEILNLGSCEVSSDALQVLVEKPCFTYNLKCLDLNSNNIDNDCLKYIANCPNLTSLTYLEIYPSRISDIDNNALNLNILFDSPFIKISNLTKKENRYFSGGEVKSKLIPKPTMSYLTSICFRCEFELFKDMLESPFVNNLTQLNLSSSRQFCSGKKMKSMNLNGKMKSICENSALSNLTKLSLIECNLYDQDMIEILNSPHLTRLTSLNVSNNCIGNKSMTVFQSAPLVSKLKFLHLSFNEISDEGVLCIANGQPTNLIVLALSGNKSLSDTSLKMISQINCNLISLRMDKIDNITDDGIMQIATSPFMKYLQTFSVEGSRISKIGAISALINLKLLLRSQKIFFRQVIENRILKKRRY